MIRAIWFGLVLLSVTVCAEALVDAELDESPQYPAVVVMLAGESKRCSATKIATRRFLTAAHCVADLSTGTPASAFAVDHPIRVSNAIIPAQRDFVLLHVERVDLHPEFERALERFQAYKEKITNGYREEHQGHELEQRIRNIESYNYFTSHYPDLSVVSVRESTPGIPIAGIDFKPLMAQDTVRLVGYGCEGGGTPPISKHGRRHWGETQVIRVDPINFYTFAHQMRHGAPSLCPGDSGGPVMRAGKIVGVHGMAIGFSDQLGAHSNMSVNLIRYETWLLHVLRTADDITTI